MRDRARRAVAVLLGVAVAAALGGCSSASGGDQSGDSSGMRAGLDTRAPAPPPTPADTGVPITRVVGLGDSVPSGAACGCASYVSLVAQQWSSHRTLPVVAVNQAVNGLTTPQLLSQVQQAGLTAPPGTATVITIGANDFDQSVLSSPGCRVSDEMSCYAPDLATMRNCLELILGLLMADPDHGPVLVTGYWNVFLDGPVGESMGSDYVRDSDALTRQVNRTLKSAAEQGGGQYVDLYKPFNSAADEGPLLAPDGDHPSAAGHQVIADAVVKALERAGF